MTARKMRTTARSSWSVVIYARQTCEGRCVIAWPRSHRSGVAHRQALVSEDLIPTVSHITLRTVCITHVCCAGVTSRVKGEDEIPRARTTVQSQRKDCCASVSCAAGKRKGRNYVCVAAAKTRTGERECQR